MYLPFYFFSSLTKLYYIWIFSLKNPDSYLHSFLYLFFLRLFLNMSKQNYLSISRPNQACMQWHTHLLTSSGEILSIPLGFFLPGRSQVILLYICMYVIPEQKLYAWAYNTYTLICFWTTCQRAHSCFSMTWQVISTLTLIYIQRQICR